MQQSRKTKPEARVANPVIIEEQILLIKLIDVSGLDIKANSLSLQFSVMTDRGEILQTVDIPKGENYALVNKIMEFDINGSSSTINISLKRNSTFNRKIDENILMYEVNIFELHHEENRRRLSHIDLIDQKTMQLGGRDSLNSSPECRIHSCKNT